MDCGVVGAAWVGFESATGGEVSRLVLVCGVGEVTWVCDCSEAVDGAGWGVGIRGAGGVREWTMGGV